MSNSPCPTLCEQLAFVTARIAHRTLPNVVLDEIKLCFLDFLAATLAASPGQFVTIAAEIFGSGPARLLYKSEPISTAGAAYIHGFLSTVEDIDDAHSLASGMHLSATVFPVALALAQSRELPMSRVLRGAVAGYEIAGRLARSMDSGLRKRGFHSTGAIGPFAACATAGAIFDLTPKQQVNAYGIAASGAGGLFAFLPSGASSRHSHAANACVTGLMAAVAAKCGVTGPLTAFEGPDGFIGPYSEDCDRSFIERPPPRDPVDFEVMNAYHKRFSACGHAIPAITLALQIPETTQIDPELIESVRIYGYKASAALTQFPAHSLGVAKFSLPVIFALAVIFGDVSAAEMQMYMIERPDVQALAAKVQVFEDQDCSSRFPAARCGRVEITLKDGKTLCLATDSPIGMPGNRLRFDDISRKFLEVAPAKVGGQNRSDVVDTVRKLKDGPAVFPRFMPRSAG